MRAEPIAQNGPLYTIRDIARELGLPESTVRYYRDAFAAHLPTVGTGRRRRYPPDALDILRTVARGFAEGRRREQIAHELGGASAAVAVSTGSLATTALAGPSPDDLLALVLDGERERREAMWQMAREIVRLGEVIERQHEFLREVAGELTRQRPALPAGAPAPAGSVIPEARFDADELTRELERLREQLEQERELVERLRRSRLAFERRAAEAESQLEELQTAPRRGGLLDRFRSQEPPGADGA